MAKKQFFLVVDTETTQSDKVADFGAIVVDKKGKIYNQCAVLTNGIYTDFNNHPLFFEKGAEFSSIWSKAGQDARYQVYNDMLLNGSRMVASVAAINRWLSAAQAKYMPTLTAYNLPFDVSKCQNTGIDLTIFSERFCLWNAAFSKFAHSKSFRQFILENHGFNAPTALGNMTFKTNAEIMARFVLNNKDLPDEPHTALEDLIYYELPILAHILRVSKKRADYMECASYNWRSVQVKDWFTAK